MILIQQIKNVIEDIERCDDRDELFLKHTELVRLILKNLPSVNQNSIEEMNEKDILSDIFYEIDESSKVIIDFISKNISFIEEDLQGTDFETQINANNQKLQDLLKQYNEGVKLYKELSHKKQEAEKLQEEMTTLQLQIDEYEQIDLEKMEREKEAMQNHLAKLEKDESENLVIYKRHLEENRRLEIKSEELSLLSLNIKNDLDSMDEKLRGVING